MKLALACFLMLLAGVWIFVAVVYSSPVGALLGAVFLAAGAVATLIVLRMAKVGWIVLGIEGDELFWVEPARRRAINRVDVAQPTLIRITPDTKLEGFIRAQPTSTIEIRSSEGEWDSRSWGSRLLDQSDVEKFAEWSWVSG